MPDDLHSALETKRLRERIEQLEKDRGGLMAAIRHMRAGRLDDRFLNDALRAELARSPCYGVLLETIEVEIRCLRRRIETDEQASVSPHLPHEISDVLTFMPESYPEFFGPWLLVAFAGGEKPRVYRPYINPKIGWP